MAETQNRIQDMEDLIEPIFNYEKLYLSHTEKLWSAREDNIIILSVEIKLQDIKTIDEAETETLNIIAKMPVFNEDSDESKDTQIQFENELNWYKRILPYLRQFQLEQGSNDVLDCFLKFYGGRYNLNRDSNVIDENAVLLLEDPTITGYYVQTYYNGFDLESAESVLRKLAKFHAIPIALKILRTDQYEHDILEPFFQERTVTIDYWNFYQSFDSILQLIQDNEYSKSNFEEILAIYDLSFGNLMAKKNYPDNCPEPYGTIIHSNLTCSKILTQVDSSRDFKMIDFSYYEYSSPVRDLIYFIFNCIDMNVIHANFEYLIDIYFLAFVNELENLKCSTEFFNYDGFVEEIRRESYHYEFIHCLIMVNEMMVDVDRNNDFLVEQVKRYQKIKSNFIIQQFFERHLV